MVCSFIALMGRKQKKNSVKSWKKSEAAKEYEDTMQKIKESEAISKLDDSAIFYEDTTGRVLFPKG